MPLKGFLASLTYQRFVKSLAGVVAVAMSVYHLVIPFVGTPQAFFFRGSHLLFTLVLVFLLWPGVKRRKDAPGQGDYVFLALSVVTILYLWVNNDRLLERFVFVDDPLPRELVLGTLFTIVVLEATRRTIGASLSITALLFVAYGLFIADVRPQAMIETLYITTEGIFGITLAASAAYVIVFVVFGSMMERTGTGQLFMDFAVALTGRTAGGPGKVAVISSSLFGTISGSAVANVLVDGPITIPLMKRTGFSKAFAAAVEATASTGGQIMPPVMGAAAFVMAEFIGVSYAQVALWALIPAVLYYVAVFFAVHFEAKRTGLVGLPKEEVPRLRRVLAERGHLFIPIVVLLYGLLQGYTAPLCAAVATLTCVPCALLRKTTRQGIGWRTVWGALEDGARNAVPVAAACACAGIIVGTVFLTGGGITFTAFVVKLSQNNLELALILTMIAGLVLGTGLPTTPSYVVMAALLVPAMIKLGTIVPAAHMFAFYFAILSAITPPVALAVYAAAGLAQANIWEAGWAAMRVGAAGFIVPFMFVYEPSLLMIGEWWWIVFTALTATFGIICLAAALHGYLTRVLFWWERAVLFAAAIALVKSGSWMNDLVGVVLFAIVFGAQKLWQHPGDRVTAVTKANP
ncbi:MAG: TRAP transporter fused permease subunit [Rhodospirillales bacterium]|nr:TRAP transporter fused permease subunit [Rhodospirillales bacterium]